jgi:hypothetical protein
MKYTVIVSKYGSRRDHSDVGESGSDRTTQKEKSSQRSFANTQHIEIETGRRKVIGF